MKYDLVWSYTIFGKVYIIHTFGQAETLGNWIGAEVFNLLDNNFKI